MPSSIDRNQRFTPAASETRDPHEYHPTILIADDEPAIRKLLETGLQEHGFDVLLAADGHEAIDLYQRHGKAIAAVLLDVCMPGLDGPETLKVLRRLNPDLQVCFMSGDCGNYDRKELRRWGRQVIPKRFRLPVVADVLWYLVTERVLRPEKT
jgi:CheY-like chemotaxis protein